MRIPRLFLSLELAANAELSLPDDAAHYLTRVLRMENGRPLTIFNGLGGEFKAELIEVSKQRCRIRLTEFIAENRQSHLQTHLAIGISKGERFEWVLQKAVELGVSKITPLLTERTEVRVKGDRQDKKTEHWQKIIISSAEQSQSNILPLLNPITDLQDLLNTAEADLKLLLHPRAEQPLQQQTKPASALLLIGPEGGLSNNEIEVAKKHNFHTLALGPRVLRTETAPVVALGILQFLWGDLG